MKIQREKNYEEIFSRNPEERFKILMENTYVEVTLE